MKSERSNISNLATFNNWGGIENSFGRVRRTKWTVRKLLFIKNGHHYERSITLFSAYSQHLTASQQTGLIKFFYNIIRCAYQNFGRVVAIQVILWARTMQRKSHFMYSQKRNCAACVCERFMYSQDHSTYFPAAEYRRWEYINRSQIHECWNWDGGRTIPFWEYLSWIFGVVSLQCIRFYSLTSKRLYSSHIISWARLG